MLFSIPVQQRSIEAIAVFLDASPGSGGAIMLMAQLPSPPASLLISTACCLLLLATSAGPAASSYLPTKLRELQDRSQ